MASDNPSAMRLQGGRELICSACGGATRAGANFCGRCGRALVREFACGRCGMRNRAANRFCGYCGCSLDVHEGEDAPAISEGVDAPAVPAISESDNAPAAQLPREIACARCGRVNSAANRFCGYCGHRLAVSDVHEGVDAPAITEHAPTAASRPPRPRLPSLPIAAIGNALAPASAFIMASGALLILAAHISLMRYDGGDAPAMMTLALALGIGVFGLGVFARPALRRLPDPLAGVVLPLARVNLRSRGRFAALAIGVVALALLAARMLAGETAAINLPLWYVALGAFFALFVSAPRLAGISRVWRVWRGRILDAAIVLGIAAAFIALNGRDLDAWYYSAIGDEYAFYSFATNILQDGILRPFSQEGVYNHHPYMSSLHQAAFMRLFEGSNYWWRFSSVFIAALAIPAIYIAGYALHSRRAAIIAAALFACSHYIFAITHSGYNHAGAMTIAAWAAALFALALRRGSPALLYAAGLAAGYGMYTHYAGRLAAPALLLFALTFVAPRDLRRLWPAALGVAAAALPTLLLEREQLFTRMLGQVVGGYDANITGAFGERVASNIVNNGAAFSHNPITHTYVSGALLDPISAYIAALGVGFALGRLGHPAARLALIWFAVAFVALGALNPHSAVAVTRMYAALPPLLIMGGAVAACLLNRLPAWILPKPTLPSQALSARNIGIAALIAVVAVTALALNARQFWVETPSAYHHTQEALAMGALQSDACGGDPGGALVVGENTESLLRWAVRGRYFGEALPYMIEHRYLREGESVPIDGLGCAIFLQPDAEEARPVKAALRGRYPQGEFGAFSGVSGKSEVEVFTPAGR